MALPSDQGREAGCYGIDALWREFHVPVALERAGQQAHWIVEVAPGDGASKRVPELAFVELIPNLAD